MRTRRWLVTAIVAVGVLLLHPAAASADGGGAYIDLLHSTHYLPGETARGRGYISVPRAKQGVLDRGPFYLYVTPERSPIIEGRPIPRGAVRVATLTITHDRGPAFTLTASFTVPDLPGDYYTLGVCNDPCTVSGFREPITGTISIVQTMREAHLLNERQHLEGDIYGLKRQMRKQVRAEADLERQLSYAEMQGAELRATVAGLQTKLTNARARADRSLPWFPILLAIIVLVFVLVGGVVVLARQRRRRTRVHDVPAMVDERQLFERSREGSFR